MHGLTLPPGDYAIPPEPTGPEAFAALPAEQQQRILDPGRKDGLTPRWDAFNAGQVQLRDFVQTTRSDDWGVTRRESGLAAALERSTRRNGGKLPGRPIAPKPPKPMPEQPADRHADLVTMTIQSPEERKAAPAPSRPWEMLEARKVMPGDLQAIIQSPSPTIRVRPEIDQKIRTKHKDAVDAYEHLTMAMDDWRYYRPSPDAPDVKWEVYMRWNESWILSVLGKDGGDGHTNLVSTYSRRNAKVQELINAGDVIERVKE